ncbi:MAG: S-adenosylmethionine:tRNA ribosyltransferase-isomerase [Mycobacterium sp.]
MMLATPHTQFDRSPTSDATEPPEAHGIPRDGVKLLVAQPSGIVHARFADLGEHLHPGDLLVVNNSATLPAAVDGTRSDRPITVHFSAARRDHDWVVELRPATNATAHSPASGWGYLPLAGECPQPEIRAGERIDLPDGAALVVGSSYPEPGVAGSRLWTSRLAIEGDVTAYLTRHGRPIRYSYVPRQWPLSSYQTVFARQPGSAEMASAARPFSSELVTSLVASGIAIAPITLHAGVSSAEAGEPPVAEPFDVPPSTARMVNLTHEVGGRVIAVGTTVTRALESAAIGDGEVESSHGWTDLVLGPDRPVRVVDGLITGWHDAGASHLLLLEAVAGADLVAAAYREAVARGYLWHEFGDSALLLPERSVTLRQYR